MSRITAVLVLAVALCALAAPATAFGEARYAEPGGGGAPCPESNPCALGAAINGALPGDEVIVLPGEYAEGPGLDSGSANLDIHGADGQPRPRVVVTGPDGFSLTGTGTVLRDLIIEGTAAALVDLTNASGERLDVHSSATDGTACRLFSTATLRNSVCRTTGNGGTALRSGNNNGQTHTTTVRNVTAHATGTNSTGLLAVPSYSLSGNTVSAVNSIFRGSGSDISAPTFASDEKTTVNVSHSNYGTVMASGLGAETVNNDGTNQSAPPVFRNAALGDLHQGAGSPTIDAGSDGAGNGTLDLDRDPRTIAGRTDIGADELVPAPKAVTGAASGVGTTAATLNGTVNANASATSYSFEWGSTAAYGNSTPVATAGSGTADQAVSAGLSGLTPATTYHYRLVATNGSGTTTGAAQTFTTAAVPSADSDGDGVPDSSDACPNQNGFGIPSGCPESPIIPPVGPTNGNDTITGTAAAEKICGLLGNDVIKALGGNDTVFGDLCDVKSKLGAAQSGAGGNDTLYGGAGNDTVYGAGGADKLFGEDGKDKLFGGGGNDSLSGGKGKDALDGGKGNDKLTGGADVNTYKGGSGDDTVNAKNDKVETIDCGAGKKDSASVDRRDKVKGCEKVKRAAK